LLASTGGSSTTIAGDSTANHATEDGLRRSRFCQVKNCRGCGKHRLINPDWDRQLVAYVGSDHAVRRLPDPQGHNIGDVTLGCAVQRLHLITAEGPDVVVDVSDVLP